MSRLKRTSHLTAVSLFSGCGGFDLGFHSAGYSTLAAFDHDERAVSSYIGNVSPAARLHDLTQPLPSDCKRLRPEVVIAGPPCQGFSTAGKRDPADPRSHLLPLAGELAVSLSPKVIVIENVLGVRVGEPARHWEALIEQLRMAKYQTLPVVCDGRSVGLAQSRRRVLLFAWNTNHTFPEIPAILPTARLDSVLAGVETHANHNPLPLDAESKLGRIAMRIGPGQKLCNVRGGARSVHTWHIPSVFGSTTAAECQILETVMRLRRSERRRANGDADPVRLERLCQECGTSANKLVKSLKAKGYLRDKEDGLDLAHSFNGKFRRLRWEDASFTVDTRFGDPHLFLHPNEHRPFTVREAARIQGFPDSYVFEGDAKAHFRLIGNAVPPPMGRFAADLAVQLV